MQKHLMQVELPVMAKKQLKIASILEQLLLLQKQQILQTQPLMQVVTVNNNALMLLIEVDVMAG